MNKSLIISFAAVFLLSATPVMAQQKPMDDMKNMPMSNMKDMRIGQPASGQAVHIAKGKVIKVDANTGVVTLSHDPVKSLNWPAMVMSFSVKNKILLDKLGVGRTVDFEFVHADQGYVITAVK
ncbi:copper-binding protein [Burkholderia multivorans]|uniref:copper-binding protein n=1 Tax=Burkholderia multivorans TaxID=87883 RepID=UPI00285A4560|nr:copper-binding protein [Burkholderia multivorans]MDR9095512.1 Cation efflux system protein CusF [Burkholderia multivorans]MDR9119291.1 Cation efflux system protein CusF [Burkholderia multivorans]MDR9158956.1 Cation efflux system protein CusF [Burkholderia multivorans]MDR9166352.1 Cation efflux system protein CusF [Burkholderia multivorans]MDR9252928.1 Cation efflux system protein CusF [Burkholderia multivorans]